MKLLVAILAAALLVLAFGVSSATAAGPGVTVIGEENVTLAVFKKAKCTKGKKKTNFYIDSTSTNGKYELTASLFDFSGFHPYDLALDENASDSLRVSQKGVFDGGWSNEFVPPYPVPGFGQIRFSANGKQIGLGFGPAMWNRDFSSAVVLAGGLECTYPKKKKK